MTRGLFWLFCCLVMMVGLVLPASAMAEPAESDGATEGYLLGPGDVLDVRVWEEEDLSGAFTVGEAGNLEVPLVGSLLVLGRTVDSVSMELQQRLAKDFLVEPQVAISIKTYASQPVQVMGAVRKPGRYLLSGPTTLLEILAEAGGILVEKSSQEIHLSRDGSTEPIVIKLEPLMNSGTGNLPLKTGDMVYVPENEVVYVSGQVVRPGPVSWHDGITLVQALTEAGGTSAGANLRKAYVLRGGKRIEVNIKSIIRGRTPDIPLRAGDQLFVDESVL